MKTFDCVLISYNYVLFKHWMNSLNQTLFCRKNTNLFGQVVHIMFWMLITLYLILKNIDSQI